LIIIGIDPGTSALGYGVVEKTTKGVRFLAKGTLRSGVQESFNGRLHAMAQQIEPLIQKWKPQACAIEKIFLGRNVDSAFKLGHIRGICMHEAMKFGAQCFEYSPRSVKQGITGSGSASKEQVQMLLYSQLGISASKAGASELDASDALALAFYHSMRMDILRRFEGTGIDV
jgi:crossover junction endodeoxyribonuclease RuvC